MPVTGWVGLEDCLSTIVGCRPEAVLDAGSGSGLWGCLLREYLDVAAGRPRPEQWRTRIDAVEIDPDRVQRYARELYTEIVIGDVREVVPRRAAEVRYDVILFGEVIEDLYKDDGRALLEAAAGLAGRLVVVRIRLSDDGWPTGEATHGPPGEPFGEPPGDPLDRPLSWWSAKDFIDQTFAGHRCQVREYHADRGSYALVIVSAG